MDIRDLAVYLAGAFALVVLLVGLAWRGRHKGSNVSPVSEQWLAEWKSRHTHD